MRVDRKLEVNVPFGRIKVLPQYRNQVAIEAEQD